MSITDELRKYAQGYKNSHDAWSGIGEELDHIADRIDAEHQKAIRKLNNLTDASVLLPVDADGVPIRVGDVLDECAVNTYAFLPAKVVGYHECCGEIMPIVENDGEFQVKPDCVCHYHAPTVEDVLREFAQEMSENMGMYTGEAIDADEWRDADARTVEKYAARLELREVGA